MSITKGLVLRGYAPINPCPVCAVPEELHGTCCGLENSASPFPLSVHQALFRASHIDRAALTAEAVFVGPRPFPRNSGLLPDDEERGTA